MSYMKRYIEAKIESLAKRYGKTWDFVHAALEFYDYDWAKVETLLLTMKERHA